MKLDKERFFKVIDTGNHLKSGTLEAYWSFYTGTAGEDIITLYKEGDQLYPDSGIHEYIKASLNSCLSLNVEEQSDKIRPIQSPMEKKSATTWGYNDDVKGK